MQGNIEAEAEEARKKAEKEAKKREVGLSLYLARGKEWNGAARAAESSGGAHARPEAAGVNLRRFLTLCLLCLHPFECLLQAEEAARQAEEAARLAEEAASKASLNDSSPDAAGPVGQIRGLVEGGAAASEVAAEVRKLTVPGGLAGERGLSRV